MKHILSDHEKAHLRSIGIPNPPDHLEASDGEYRHHMESWRNTMPKTPDEELHKRVLGNIAWRKHAFGEFVPVIKADAPASPAVRPHQTTIIHKYVATRLELRLILAVLILILLALLWPRKAHAQFSHINSIQWQNAGSNISNGFFAFPFTINCSTNLSCTSSNGVVSITASSTASTAFSAITAATNSNLGSFIMSGNALDLTATTFSGLRVATGLTTTKNGDIGQDSTTGFWHLWFNAHDRLIGAFTNTGSSGQVPISNGDGTYTVADPIVSGPDAPGVAPTKNPVQMGGFDGTNVQRVKTDASGNIILSNLPATADTNNGSASASTIRVQQTTNSSSGTITTSAGQNFAWNTTGMGCSGVVVSGTWTGTLSVQQSNDGTNWQPADTLQQLLGKWPETIGSNGRYYIGGFAAQQVRLNGPTATGTASVSVVTSPMPCNQYVFAMPGAEAGNGMSALAATGTQTEVADVVTGYATAEVATTWASITGSPSGCTIQAQGSPDGSTFMNVGTAQSVTPGTNVMQAFTGPFGLAARFVYACSAYPSGGTISMGVTYKHGGTVAIGNSPSVFVAGTPAANVTQFAGTAVDTNSGNKSAGTLRVVLATDQPALTNKLLVTPDLPSGAATAALQTADPCGDGVAKSYAFYDASTNGATQLVALSSGKIIYVCSYSFSSSSSTANTLKLVYGTGSNCATGQTAITPGIVLQAAASQGPIGKVMPNSRGLATIASNALCVLTNAAQAAQAEVSYVQQ